MKNNSHGFTLIEVMVAIAVIGIAVPALLFSMMAEIEGAAHMRDKLEAQWVADNLMEQVRIDNRLSGAVPEADKSGEEEQSGRKWFWKSRSKAFPQPELSDIYGVEVSVWRDDSRTEEPLVKIVGIIQQFKNEAILRGGAETLSDIQNGNGAQGENTGGVQGSSGDSGGEPSS